MTVATKCKIFVFSWPIVIPTVTVDRAGGGHCRSPGRLHGQATGYFCGELTSGHYFPDLIRLPSVNARCSQDRRAFLQLRPTYVARQRRNDSGPCSSRLTPDVGFPRHRRVDHEHNDNLAVVDHDVRRATCVASSFCLSPAHCLALAGFLTLAIDTTNRPFALGPIDGLDLSWSKRDFDGFWPCEEGYHRVWREQLANFAFRVLCFRSLLTI